MKDGKEGCTDGQEGGLNWWTGIGMDWYKIGLMDWFGGITYGHKRWEW